MYVRGGGVHSCEVRGQTWVLSSLPALFRMVFSLLSYLRRAGRFSHPHLSSSYREAGITEAVYSTLLLHGFKLGPPCLRGKHFPTESALPSAPTGRTIKLRLGCEGRALIQGSSADPCHFVPHKDRRSSLYEPLGRSSSGMQYLFPPWS